jgi:1-acyl-sn-glycerol-3-phosphate acyltransferase
MPTNLVTRPIMAASQQRRQPADVPYISPLLLRLFTAYVQRYLRRALHAVRRSRAGTRPELLDVPLVIYGNHPSWWDPLLCLFVAYRLFPERWHYGPIDADALARYRFFASLGFFGVKPGTRRGAATFLRVSQAVLERPGTALWMTPEGRFSDPRQRPLELQSGLGHLASRLSRVAFVPLGLEYPFWEERFPEALIRFGEATMVVCGQERSPAAWTDLLAGRLEATLDRLADEACQRQRQAFDVILSGRAGVGGVYDGWRALRACLRGERFRKAHGE